LQTTFPQSDFSTRSKVGQICCAETQIVLKVQAKLDQGRIEGIVGKTRGQFVDCHGDRFGCKEAVRIDAAKDLPILQPVLQVRRRFQQADLHRNRLIGGVLCLALMPSDRPDARLHQFRVIIRIERSGGKFGHFADLVICKDCCDCAAIGCEIRHHGRKLCTHQKRKLPFVDSGSCKDHGIAVGCDCKRLARKVCQGCGIGVVWRDKQPKISGARE
jgi:hypothetical protein